MKNLPTEEISLVVNGLEKNVKANLSITEYLETLQIPNSGILVELNGTAIKTEKLNSINLKDGDKLELVRLVQGG